MAPERFEEREDELPVRPSKQSDIYSFGSIMLLVCLGSSNPASLLTRFLGPHQQKSLSLYPNSARRYAEHNHLFQACKNSL
jgi:serine/threonine protein kinase